MSFLFYNTSEKLFLNYPPTKKKKKKKVAKIQVCINTYFFFLLFYVFTTIWDTQDKTLSKKDMMLVEKEKRWGGF